MAVMLMRSKALVALQARALATPTGKSVVTSVLKGSEVLVGELQTKYALLGLSSPGMAVSAEPKVTPAIAEQIKKASQALPDPAPCPLWMHIPRDSPRVAMFPWEREVHRLTGRPLIMVPNFVDDPFQPTKQPVVAVCISLPRAKVPGLGDVDEIVAAQFKVLSDLAGDAIRKVQVHVFPDADLWQDVNGLATNTRREGTVEFNVHNPRDSRLSASPRASREVRRGSSPWLAWMSEVLAGQTVDIFHFLCPGYHDGVHGALAFSESPANNNDPYWSRFVGAEELADFLDAHGTSAMSVTNPTTGEWKEGLRLLAFELGWLRAGPIILTGNDANAAPTLRCVFELLYGFASHDLKPLCSTYFSCHPRYFFDDAEDSEHSFGLAPLARAILPSSENVPAPFANTSSTVASVAAGPRRSVDLPETAQSLSERQLLQSMASVGKLQANSVYRTWENQGSANAASFVRELLEKGKPSPPQTPVDDDDTQSGAL